jgi:two-component system phosphate regulon response regulator PhoB
VPHRTGPSAIADKAGSAKSAANNPIRSRLVNRKFVVTPTRIVLIEEGPLIEKLVSLLESSGGQASVVQSGGDRVCEAHILAPNLILLELTQAHARHAETAPPHRNGKSHGNAPGFKLAVTDAELASRLSDFPIAGSEPAELDGHATSEAAAETEPAIDSSAWGPDPVLQIGPVRIDRHGHWAYLADKKLHLTPTEFRLLECFLRAPGRAFTRSQLLEVSIGHSSYVLERTIDVHIRSLRAKLGPVRDLVETVRGVGYRFRAADVEP